MVKSLKTGISEQSSKTNDRQIREAVEKIIAAVENRGDAAVREYSERFDHWSPQQFRLTSSQMDDLRNSLPRQVIADIEYAQDQVRRFARAQLESLHDVEIEIQPGVTLGHKNIPIENVGCYIPGGGYPLVSSAHMNIIPARVAGVNKIVACTPPLNGELPAATITAMAMAGADEIYILGGVQAVAAMALGTESIPAVDMLVGPGNAYVAEAKRQLFGRVGIDLFAGPSEVLIIADETADAELVAVDLLGQAEHGVNSPCVLLTTSRDLAEETLLEIERQLKTLPTANIAEKAWRDYGQVLVADSPAEVLEIANGLAYEHVEVLTRNPDDYLAGLSNYGSLFLGAETTVSYGDVVIGTNHTLPTRRAARFTGGLWVGKFIKTVTYQRCTPEASAATGEIGSRLCALEGIWGHKAQADLRVARYGKTG